MRLLAFDTASDACAVAIDWDGVVQSVQLHEPRRQAELLLPAVDDLLARVGGSLEALDAIVLGRGPGSFTGVRIATAVCQGLAWGLALPVVPVSSLAILAQGAYRRGGRQRLLVVQDARMGEVYAGVYSVGADGLAAALVPDRLCTPQGLAPPAGGAWAACGSAWAVHDAALRTRLGAVLVHAPADDAPPDARDALALGAAALGRGESVTAAQAVPLYLRDQVTTPPAPRR